MVKMVFRVFMPDPVLVLHFNTYPADLFSAGFLLPPNLTKLLKLL